MSTNAVCSDCISCILDKYLTKYPPNTPEDKKLEYMKAVLKTIAELDESITAPEAVALITKLQKDILATEDDFVDAKKYFNNLMLSVYPKLEKSVKNDENPLYRAVCYALTANYIDFGAMKEVDENKLLEMLEDSQSLNFSKEEFQNLKNDIMTSKRMVYLTDNCGEIVADKLLVSIIKTANPSLEISVIVRGAPVLNDATMADAVQVGLCDVTNVISNGTPVAGTCLGKITTEAQNLIDNADFIISKGQGNFETLCGCERNVYYLFLCKCELFARRFKVDKFTEMLLNDRRM